MELVERLRSEAEADEGLFLTRSAKLKREAADLLEEALKALEPFARTEVLEPNGVIVGLERYHFDRARAILTKSRGEKIDPPAALGDTNA